MKVHMAMNGTAVITLSESNLKSLTALSAQGRTPVVSRYGNPDENEPTAMVTVVSDEDHYGEHEAYMRGERGSAPADLFAEMQAVLLETDELLEAGADPDSERFHAVVARLKSPEVEELTTMRSCRAGDNCCGGECA